MLTFIISKILTGLYYTFGCLYMLIFQLSLLPLWLPIFILRQIAILTAKLRSDFGEPLEVMNVNLSEDVTKPHKGSAMCTMTLKGLMSASELRTLFVKNVIERRLPDNGKPLQFPELKQYQTKHLGFLFYRNDPDFKIENHIHPDVSQKNDPDFRSYETILETVSYRPFPEKRSAWEMFVVPNFKDPKLFTDEEPKTLIVLRIHHTQIDGYSLMSVLISALGEKGTYVTPKASTLENTETFSFFNAAPKFIEGFIGLQTRYLHNINFQKSIKGRNPNAVGKVIHRVCPLISKDLVKKIAKRHNVRLPAVLMALVGQNLTKIFEKSDRILPKNAHASYGIPIPNHPGRLTVHVKVGAISLSFLRKSLVLRMKELNEEFLKLKDDPTTDVVQYLGSIFGCLFPPLTKFFLRNSAYVPFSITNFAGDSEGFSVGGRECLNLTGTCGPHEDISDALIVFMGYKEHINVSICVNDCLLSENEAEELIQGIWEDFQGLVKQIV